MEAEESGSTSSIGTQRARWYNWVCSCCMKTFERHGYDQEGHEKVQAMNSLRRIEVNARKPRLEVTASMRK